MNEAQIYYSQNSVGAALPVRFSPIEDTYIPVDKQCQVIHKKSFPKGKGGV